LGLYDIVLGLSLNGKMRKLMPAIEKYSTQEQIDSYKKGLEFWPD